MGSLAVAPLSRGLGDTDDSVLPLALGAAAAVVGAGLPEGTTDGGAGRGELTGACGEAGVPVGRFDAVDDAVAVGDVDAAAALPGGTDGGLPSPNAQPSIVPGAGS